MTVPGEDAPRVPTPTGSEKPTPGTSDRLLNAMKARRADTSAFSEYPPEETFVFHPHHRSEVGKWPYYHRPPEPHIPPYKLDTRDEAFLFPAGYKESTAVSKEAAFNEEVHPLNLPPSLDPVLFGNLGVPLRTSEHAVPEVAAAPTLEEESPFREPTRDTRKTPKKPDHLRNTLAALAALSVASSSDVTHEQPQLPRTEETGVRRPQQVSAETSPLLQEEVVRAALPVVEVTATTEGAIQLFYRFFRLLRHESPELYAQFVGADTPLAAAERFSKDTRLWVVGPGVDTAITVYPGDRLYLVREGEHAGELAYERANGAPQMLTAHRQPKAQGTWTGL